MNSANSTKNKRQDKGKRVAPKARKPTKSQAKPSFPVAPRPKPLPQAVKERQIALRGTLKARRQMERYAHQFLLPGDSGGRKLKVTPANGSAQLCVRHLHKVIDVDSTTLPAGFTCVMRPDLTSPGFISSAAAILMPAAAGLLSLSFDARGDSSGACDLKAGLKGTATGASEEQAMIKLEAITDTTPTTHQGFYLTPGPATAASMTYVFQETCTIQMYTKAAGAWAIAALRSGTKGDTVSVPLPIPANTSAVAWSYTAGPLLSTPSVRVSIAFDSAQLTSTAASTLAPAFSKFILESQITHGRVISMSLLATNTSPELARGGNINAARVPHTQNVFSNIPSDIALLPSNRRWQREASTGAYVWWMPSQIDELEPDAIDRMSVNYREADFLMVNVAGWGAGGNTSTFRLQFDWLVEFYTPSQLFEKIQTPPMTREFEALYHALLELDAATCNPGHMDLLRDLFTSGVEKAKAAYAFYKEHEAAFNSAATIIAALAAA